MNIMTQLLDFCLRCGCEPNSKECFMNNTLLSDNGTCRCKLMRYQRNLIKMENIIMTTKIDILKTYCDIINLAKDQKCSFVQESYEQMTDDLEYDIINTYLNDVI